jgi:hypothetical protein
MRSRIHALNCRNRLTIAFLVGILPSFAMGDEPLRWRFRTDERIAIEVDQNSDVRETSQSESRIRQRTSLAWRVIEVDSDGTATIEQRTQRVRLSISDSKEEHSTDSDTAVELSALHPKIKTIWTIVSAPMNAKLQFRLSSLGDIIDFETSQPNEILHNPKVAIAFPKSGPKIGEPWTVQSHIKKQNWKLLLTTSYQLVGKEMVDGRELSKIKTSTAFQLDGNSQAKLVSQNAQGLFWFDPAEGKLARSKSHQEIGIEMHMNASTTVQSIQQSTEISYQFE